MAQQAARRCVALCAIRTVRPRDYDGLGYSVKGYLDCYKPEAFEDDKPEFLEVVCWHETVQHFDEEETVIELYQLP